MRWLRENLVVKFSVVSFVVMTAIAGALAVTLSNKIRSDALDALSDEAVGASSGRLLRVITPADLEVPMTGARYDRFHEFVRQSVVSERTARVKLWAKDGTVIYSNDPAGVGEKFPTNQNLLKALRGEKAIQIKIPKDAENERERFLGTLMEVYTPITFPGATEPKGVLEIYQYYEPTARRIVRLRDWVFWSIGMGFVVLYGGLVSTVWGGWRTIVRQRSQLQSFNVHLEKQVQERTTELRQAQERLVRTERLAAIGELSAGVAHEVKNPLMCLLLGVQYLSKRVSAGDDNVAVVLKDMGDAVRRADGVIKGLLDFAAPKELDLTPQDVNAIADQSLLLVKHELDRSHIRVIKELGKDLAPVRVDRNKIQQALINLFTNAVHAMPQGGTLTVRTHEKTLAEPGPQAGSRTDRLRSGETAVVVEVDDTGTGIPEGELSKIFDPFFTTESATGTGLGLTVTEKIVKLHGGTIDVRNRSEGGARATMIFKAEGRT